MITRAIIAGIAAIGVMVIAAQVLQEKGVQKERARVEVQGKKTHAKAAKARQVVEAKPAPEIRDDLRKWCVDCASK